MKPIIRKLKKEDAKELAHNMITMWNDTYKGIIDDDFLEKLHTQEHIFVKRIEIQAEENLNYFVLELENKIIGWIYYSLTTNLYQNTAEVYSLYILKEYHKKGYDKLLLNFAIKNIKKNNINKMIIGCLKENPSNDFYKHMGGEIITTRLFKNKYIENLYMFNI